MKTLASTLFALLAFAANSVLCRLALGENAIDATSFTVIRLLSGIVILILVMQLTSKSNEKKPTTKGSWLAASMLFIYAIAFSFGYVSLDTGTGALILFGAVQITMIMVNVISGNKLHFTEWTGLVIAFTGFVYLIIPSLVTPSFVGFILMAISGIAWGLYTLLGRTSTNPLSDTAYNFLRTSPFILILVIFGLDNVHITSIGILFAILSGAIASGIGYFVWYIALRGLSVTQAAVVQLFVPVIAGVGGVIFTNELITHRLIESSALVLGGILMVILGRYYFVQLALKKKKIV
ncbi:MULTISPECIES: DMT family transporter [unclassified Colwellia]|uniref:DMT family transporter n=1 Tax=unclassified Colwellia TaxID=196834 RepID=UPI0015F3C587|nr:MULTISPECIES: DMT family transporter [unclassified Colwellia]MBA6232701.1 DMT family transporter [Colwellia sp. MB02u-7]MBA6236211.1 DMT family transporter [Colwellia sp. MB02u-11]MBA6256537.1 DMT family transporter [Colwellia sp. MB3u-28]MBA6261252.1 DMT family transporter [Colwellia sp. MB3u-41]MBA6298389.1 DMT family transporter [Colwellia sp. MB3u-22]